MRQPGSDTDLALEALAANRVRKVGVQYLERDLAPVAKVGRQVHGRHAAGTECLVDPIAIGERNAEGSEEIRRRHHV